MAQTKSSSTKSDSKKNDSKRNDSKKRAPSTKNVTKSVDEKTVQKKAKKALAKAEKSVRAAHEAVKSSSKKLRKEAMALSQKTEKLTAKHEKAARKLAIESAKVVEVKAAGTPASKLPSRTATPLPTTAHAPVSLATSGRDTSSTKKRSLTPPLPKPSPVAPTLIELRRQAKEQKIRGFSRLSKADLIAALEASRHA